MKMAYEKRKSMYGYCFIALWFVGALIFFLIPVVESLLYSFQEITPDTGGMVGSWVGMDNYNYAFNVDPNYRQYLVKVLKDTAWKTPLILVFSLFVAVILNQKFKGRTFSRAVFFLPVIIATGPVYNHHQRQPAKHRQQRCQPVFHHVFHRSAGRTHGIPRHLRHFRQHADHH